MNQRVLLLLIAVVLCSLQSIAQAPPGIPYQAIARDDNGNPLVNQSVSFRFSVHDQSAGGAVVYSETHSTMTNEFGLVNLVIGAGSVSVGTFDGIDWGGGSKFVQVEFDPAGGTSFNDMGTTQMLSVPYALNAGNGNWKLNGNSISNTNNGNVGIGTANPISQLDVVGNGNPYIFSVRDTVNNVHLTNYIGTTPDGTFKGFLGTTTPHDLAFYTNDSWEQMIIEWETGNVGIGTTSPTTRLDVNGRIKSNTLSGVGNRPVYADANGELFSAANVFSYNSADAGTLQEGACETFYNSITVANAPSLVSGTDISVTLNLSNPTGLYELIVYLYSPDGSVLPLMGVQGNGATSLVGTTFSDAGAATLPFGSEGAPFTGMYKPVGINNNFVPYTCISANKNSFSDFGTFNPNGTWSLMIWDAFDEDYPGTLTSWSISVQEHPAVVTGVDNYVAKWSNGTLSETSTIYDDGNVGIGTSEPSHHLHVAGSNTAMRLEGTGYNGSGARLNFGDGNYTYIEEDIDDGLTINSLDRTAIIGGEVGIGTLQPSHRLHVAGMNTALRLEGTGLSGSGARLNFGDGDYTYIEEDIDDGLTIKSGLRTAILGGDVGIGTLQPSHRLHIAGTNNAMRLEGTGLSGSGARLNFGDGNYTYIEEDIDDGLTIKSVLRTAILGGNVGIGTDQPSHRLHIAGTNNAMRLEGTGYAGSGARLYFGDGDFAYIGEDIDDGLTINSLNRTAILGGNVGIGTAYPDPGAKLHVEVGFGQVYIHGEPGGDQFNGASYPLFIDGTDNGIMIRSGEASVNENINFISFDDANNIRRGRIEGFNPISDFGPDLCDISPSNLDIEADAECIAEWICWANEFFGAVPTDPLGFISWAINLELQLACTFGEGVGVAYVSGYGDYAEYLEKQNPAESFIFGEVVGVKAGKITKSTEQAEQYMVISAAPIVLGNAPPHDSLLYRYETVAFMGQVPVKIYGKVKSGDYLIPSGANDGFALAVSGQDLKIEQIGQIIGRAWEDHDSEFAGYVLAVLGVRGSELTEILAQFQNRISGLEKQLEANVNDVLEIKKMLLGATPEASGDANTHSSISTTKPALPQPKMMGEECKKEIR